jgi:hypothetical protein
MMQSKGGIAMSARVSHGHAGIKVFRSRESLMDKDYEDRLAINFDGLYPIDQFKKNLKIDSVTYTNGNTFKLVTLELYDRYERKQGGNYKDYARTVQVDLSSELLKVLFQFCLNAEIVKISSKLK